MDVLRRWTARASVLPAGLLGMLVLVLAAESFVTRHDLDVLDPDDWQYHLARRSSTRHAKGRDLLCFGDSLMRVGVRPKLIEKRSGLKAYNLAICGSQTPASYAVLSRALEGGARPSAVLLECHPALLALKADANQGHWPYLLGYGSLLELGWQAHDPALLGDLLARRTLPSLRARSMVRAWVVAAVSGVEPKVRYDMPPVFRHWAKHAGAQLMPSKAGAAWNVADHQRFNYPVSWKPNRVNAEYLRRFFALAEARGVAVYWLLPPVHPGVQREREASGFEAKYLAFVRSMQARFPTVVVIDGRAGGYDPDVFFDPDHLGGEGAAALSEDIGDALRVLRAGAPPDRWVTLPPYRRRADAPAVADLYTEIAAAHRTAGAAVQR